MDSALRQQQSRAAGRNRSAPQTPQIQAGVVSETTYMTSVEHSRHGAALDPKYANNNKLSSMRRLRQLDGSSD